MEEQLYEIYENDHLLASKVPLDCISVFIRALLETWYADPSLEIKIKRYDKTEGGTSVLISDYV